MCFNPFKWSLRDLPGLERNTKKSNLQDRAEDISFEEVDESTNEQPKIDEKKRVEQIGKAVEEKMSGLMEKSPIAGLLHMTTFIVGANWADEHPLSSYKDHSDWMAAQYEEVQKLVNKASGHKDYLFETIVFATFANGAMWANENPAPTL